MRVNGIGYDKKLIFYFYVDIHGQSEHMFEGTAEASAEDSDAGGGESAYCTSVPGPAEDIGQGEG